MNKYFVTPESASTANPECWQQASFVRRYKRFMADVALPDGAVITLHCPNTGSMRNCLAAGAPCWYSTSANPLRKYPHTLEVVTTPDGHLAGVNTGRANRLVESALARGLVEELRGYSLCQREVRYGEENSRVDFFLGGHVRDPRPCYVEVKSVTLMAEPGRGLFPDAVSERGSKHLRELAKMAQRGCRAILLFCVQHTGIISVQPADEIDPIYGKNLRDAVTSGVEIIAYQSGIVPAQATIALERKISVVI